MMNTHRSFEDRLYASLAGLAVDRPRVEVFPADFGGYKYFGRVISPSFEGKYEGQRQALVWERILSTLDEEDQARVEFIFADTPDERDERSRRSAQPATTQGS